MCKNEMHPNSIRSDSMMLLEETVSTGSVACGATRNENARQGSAGSVGEIDDSNHGKLLAEVTSSGIPAFPWRLHDMLDDAPRKNFENIVSWQMGGRAFKVHDTKLFVSNIMPNYFNQNHYKSFQRQLNIYGFQRLTHGKDKGAYTHELLVQGNSDMCRYMIRVKIKNKGSKTKSAHSSTSNDSALSSSGGGNRRGRGIARNRSCPQTLLQMKRAFKSEQQEPLETNRKNSLFLGSELDELASSAIGNSSTMQQRPTGHPAARKRSLSLGCILDFDSSKLSYASLQQPLGNSSGNQSWLSSSNTHTLNNDSSSLFQSTFNNNNVDNSTVDPLFGRPSQNPMTNSRTTAAMLKHMTQMSNQSPMSSNTMTYPDKGGQDDIMMDIFDDFEDANEVNQPTESKAIQKQAQVSPYTIFSSTNPTPLSTPISLPYKNRRDSMRPMGLNEMIETIAPDVADEMVKMFAL